MRILLTGNEGYLGSVVGPALIERGHDVTGIDTGYYLDGRLPVLSSEAPRTRRQDLRRLTIADLDGYDAVVHMAELSNDPLGALSPRVTFEINHAGSVRLANLAKSAGIERFVYISSCSVYGIAETDCVDERSPVDPRTAYAECKVRVERDVTALADDGFSPTFLRLATAFGASPRMRFDVVLNNLAGTAWITRKIAMTSDGSPWRPLVHALDIARAVTCVLDAPRDAIHREVLNVGATENNYQVRDIADAVGRVFAGCSVTFCDGGADNRSYKVSFDKIGAHLPDFRCAWDAEAGARQLFDLFERMELTRETFEFRAFTRVRQLEHLLRTGQIDDRLYWTERVPREEGAPLDT